MGREDWGRFEPPPICLRARYATNHTERMAASTIRSRSKAWAAAQRKGALAEDGCAREEGAHRRELEA